MQTILVAVDFSEITLRIMALVTDLARAGNCEVHLLHVRPAAPIAPVLPMAAGVGGFQSLGMAEIAGVPMAAPLAGGAAMGSEETPAGEQQLEQLARWQAELTGAGLRVTVHETEGSAIERILDFAETVNADLIVLGSHGHGALHQLFVGSVSEGVLRNSTRPVLLVPAGKTNAPLAEPGA